VCVISEEISLSEEGQSVLILLLLIEFGFELSVHGQQPSATQDTDALAAAEFRTINRFHFPRSCDAPRQEFHTPT